MTVLYHWPLEGIPGRKLFNPCPANYIPELRKRTLDDRLSNPPFEPRFPISNSGRLKNPQWLTTGRVLPLRNAVKHPICAHETTCGVASNSSIAWECYSRYTWAPYRVPPGTHLALGYPSSPLMTSRIFATLVLDGAHRYAPALAGIPPWVRRPPPVETPPSWHAAPNVHLS